MGKKLDALMGKNSKSSNQLKPLLNLALSRLVVLKNQRRARCSLSRSDVVQLLTLNHHDRALLRVEQVIKEENMIDVFGMVEGYCFIIMERIHLIEEQIRECPEDVNEAVSSLIYAASRCGEFPELQEIRAIFTQIYGKEFAARAIELRNNCTVNRQMVIKLSPRQPDLKSRLKMLNEIAAENNIVLQIQDITTPPIDLDDQVILDNNNQSRIKETKKAGSQNLEELTDSIKTGRQYKDVADAAQAAFESAAYAAAAARAAVELSKPQSHRRQEIYESSDEDEEMVEEQDDDEIEDEGLQRNRSNLKGEEEEVKKEEDDEKEDLFEMGEVDLKLKLKQSSSSQTAPNSKPRKTKRFIEWTRRRRLWRSRAGEEQE